MNVRKLVLNALIKQEKQNSYSNLMLNSVLNTNELTGQEKRFASSLFYGVIERKITLDYYISHLSSKPNNRLSPLLLNALRLGIYQLIYMDKVPESAAVNETVSLVKASKEKYAAGFVNAVLRNFLRNTPTLPESTTANELEIIYSCPAWFIEELVDYLGASDAANFFENSLKVPPTYIRLNSLIKGNNTIETLAEKGITVKDTALESCFSIVGTSSVETLLEYINGEIYVQDIASQLAISALSPKPGERLLDICAAPGGKSFTSAQYMNNSGEIVSCDLHEHRVKLIEHGAERMGISIITAHVNDATKHNSYFSDFDKIICDVPCSGFGDIRRKPEIKYKNPQDLTKLPILQYNILNEASHYLKIGGLLMYSTCTLRYAENEAVVEKFLNNHPEYRLKKSTVAKNNCEYHRLFSSDLNCDGFFFVLLEKIGDHIGKD